MIFHGAINGGGRGGPDVSGPDDSRPMGRSPQAEPLPSRTGHLMEQFNFYAYESLGHWTIAMSCREVLDTGHSRSELIYRSDHPAIDDEDRLFRAVQLLSQTLADLQWAMDHSRPAHIEAN